MKREEGKRINKRACNVADEMRLGLKIGAIWVNLAALFILDNELTETLGPPHARTNQIKSLKVDAFEPVTICKGLKRRECLKYFRRKNQRSYSH